MKSPQYFLQPAVKIADLSVSNLCNQHCLKLIQEYIEVNVWLNLIVKYYRVLNELKVLTALELVNLMIES